jgi:D-alanyl-D-alanine carboxypeptidase
MSRTVAETADVAAALAPYLESWLDHQRRRARVPGVQAAVRVGDRLVLDTALGVADVSTGEPLTTGHLFRIASHSKTFTATAVLQLVEAGRIRLDDPIERWVPALAGSALAEVTVRELLGHQGGVVRDGRDCDHWQLLRPFPERLMRRRESEIRAHGGEPQHYGLGVDLRTEGERELIGHGGGYPGHITRTWIDPAGQVVVSVLTNAIDGPADVLARGLLRLLDLALAARRTTTGRRPSSSGGTPAGSPICGA